MRPADHRRGSDPRAGSLPRAVGVRLATAVVLTAVALLGACGEPDPSGAPAWSPILQAERQRPLTDRTFEATAERLARGEHLALGILQCVDCHSPIDSAAPGWPPIAGREFSGRVFRDNATGRLVAPNLTPDEETGAGLWTDDVLARAIREGVGHDGRGLGLPMYWASFANLSDEDLASVVVYLRSLAPVRNPLPDRRLTAEAEAQRAAGARPLSGPVPERSFEAPWQLGQYLIEVGDCMGCHTSWSSDPGPGLGGGGNRIAREDEDGLPVFSRNITPDPTGIGGWSKEDFRWAMRTGKGGDLHPSMRWTSFARLTDEELDAIYETLFLMDPVRHVVGNRVPPTRCETCGQMHGLGHVNVPLEPPTGRPLEPGRAGAYPGRYHHSRWGQTFEIRLVADTLRAVWDEAAGEVVPLLWQGEDEFVEAGGLRSTYRFVRGEAGRVEAVDVTDVGPQRFDRVEESANESREDEELDERQPDRVQPSP
ncbi:MAG TPA: hypothetical protein VK858_05130 [Longimicrobiales bacterium]|nr:hypothetical protein [Longimicrobiales bacterium]